MRQRVTAWATGLILGLLIFTASALGEDPKVKHTTLLSLPNVIVGSVQIEGNTPITVVVIRGQQAKALKQQCNCEEAVYPELNLVILLDDSLDI